MGFEEWWEANFDWLDPPHAELGGLLALAFLLTLGTVLAAYLVAWYWHRFRDPKAKGPD